MPETLAATAAELGLSAVALCDRMGVYGSPRFRTAAKEHGVRALVGAELVLPEGGVLRCSSRTAPGYQNLCQMLTRAHLRAAKGESVVQWDELAEFSAGLVALTGCRCSPPTACNRRRRSAGRSWTCSPACGITRISTPRGRCSRSMRSGI